MGLFSKKSKGILGVDIGAGGIKVLELHPGAGRGKLWTYGYSERAPEQVGQDWLADPAASGAHLKTILSKAKTTTVQAVTALPIPAVFSTVLTISQVPQKELKAAVEWEAKKLVPLPLEQVKLDFRVLKPAQISALPKLQSGKEQSAQILLTAAPKSIIEKYLALAKAAGLTLAALETEAFALIRALLGTDPTPTVLLDLGSVKSNILIVDSVIPMLTRSVDVGGQKYTQAIATALSVPLDKAEAMKRDISALQSSGAHFTEMLKEVFGPLMSELKYSLQVYSTRNDGARVPERIVITGGSARIAGLRELIEQEFNLKTYLGNPWEGLQYHPDLQGLLSELGPRFSVAIGLALRNL